MRVHLVNPNHLSFGVGVITPRWLYVLAAATPRSFGDPVLVDETLAAMDSTQVQPGDVVGIGIHSGNALRGYEIGRMARERGAHVIFGGIHTSLYPQEAFQLGGAHAVVKGDGDVVWARVLGDCANGLLQQVYEGGRIEADQFLAARWELMPRDSYMWASVQTVRGCPKHFSFWSVWRTDGQRPRQRTSDGVIHEIIELRRMGFRFIALADDNFYPVTLQDLELARRQNAHDRLAQLQAIRDERFELLARLAELPKDMVFFTPFPGTVDFQRWEKSMESDPTRIGGFPLTRYWLIPQALRPKVYMSHPVMSAEEIRAGSQGVWDRFYSLRSIWKRSRVVKSLRSRLAFVFISKLYRQMYANTGIATDSARANRANRWARWLAKPCLRLFQAPPMPELIAP